MGSGGGFGSDPEAPAPTGAVSEVAAAEVYMVLREGSKGLVGGEILHGGEEKNRVWKPR